MWEKYIKPALKILLIILLITAVLSFFRSCSSDRDPAFTLDFGDNKFSDFLTNLADLIPGGFIGIRDYDGNAEHTDNGSGDGTDDGSDDASDDGTNDGSDDGTDDGTDDSNKDEHNCDGTLEVHNGKQATCVSTGNYAYYECTECGKLYNGEMVEFTSEDLIIPIDYTRHDWGYIANGDGTHSQICKLNNSHTDLADCAVTENWRYNSEEHYKCCIYCSDVEYSEPHEKDSPEDEFCVICGYEFTGDSGNEGDGSGDNLDEVEPDEPDFDPDEIDYLESFGPIDEDNWQYEYNDDNGYSEGKYSIDIPYLQFYEANSTSRIDERTIRFNENSSTFVRVDMFDEYMFEIEIVFKDADLIDYFLENARIYSLDGETVVTVYGYKVEGNTVYISFYCPDCGLDTSDYWVSGFIIECEGLSVNDLKYFNIYIDECCS